MFVCSFVVFNKYDLRWVTKHSTNSDNYSLLFWWNYLTCSSSYWHECMLHKRFSSWVANIVKLDLGFTSTTKNEDRPNLVIPTIVMCTRAVRVLSCCVIHPIRRNNTVSVSSTTDRGLLDESKHIRSTILFEDRSPSIQAIAFGEQQISSAPHTPTAQHIYFTNANTPPTQDNNQQHSHSHPLHI